ncbi:pyridoxine 4-dehydrogenase [Sporothrix schenckii 1099-18]|uniref:Pyridoxine 4-dehydrogenase n=1 Tax=Sporothrix schenckii 1099-18 TaxID=1397361 RepID=A0A0F2MC08_SPOSC|nr:pyridoxine 4-dehydrogenase [Sporothrix schenckii 1099-18]KJR87238.1 pyridoxine 4-dehydrogenase [Sporothrix schenckii 1099-18]
MPQLAGKQVGPIGYGLMGLTRPDSPLSDDEKIAAMRAALDAGANFWNGGEFYGPESANSLVLLEKYFAKYPDDADRVVLSIKGGMDKPNTFKPDSGRANVRRSVLDSAAQLQGRKVMDLFEVGRHDRVTPWPTTVAAFQELIQEGAFRAISLSEVTADSVHAAVAAAADVGAPPIAACEEELSLLTADILTDGVAAACAQHNIPIIAYSPVGRGLLTGQVRSQADLYGAMARFPRFSADNLPQNLQLVDALAAYAARKGCTLPQLAINWARCQSLRAGMPATIIPIPGGTTVERVRENLKVVDLTIEDLDALDAIRAKYEVQGGRYPGGMPGKA